MNILRHSIRNSLLAVVPMILLANCGGGSTADKEELPVITKMTLAITDAPVDNAVAVNVRFTGVEIKPASGDSFSFDFPVETPKNIDLLALQGGGSEIMLNEVEIEPGEYSWIRLKVEAEKGEEDSYLQEIVDGPKISLWVPSGSQTGLKLNHSFVVAAGGSANFTIDFDLRKSITNPVGQDDYILKPSMRIVDNNEVGEISGTVASDLVNDGDCLTNTDGIIGSSVYVFNADTTTDPATDATPDDYDGDDADGADPVSSAMVEMDQSGAYNYTAAFLSAGSYTIAFTCDAAVDVSDEDNSDVITFIGTTTVDVEANTTTIHDFVVDTAQ